MKTHQIDQSSRARIYTWNIREAKTGNIVSTCEMVARNATTIRRVIARQARNECFGRPAIFGKIKSRPTTAEERARVYRF